MLLPGGCPLSARAGAALLPCKPGAAPTASWAGIRGLGGAAEQPCPPGVLLAVQLAGSLWFLKGGAVGGAVEKWW